MNDPLASEPLADEASLLSGGGDAFDSVAVRLRSSRFCSLLVTHLEGVLQLDGAASEATLAAASPRGSPHGSPRATKSPLADAVVRSWGQRTTLEVRGNSFCPVTLTPVGAGE